MDATSIAQKLEKNWKTNGEVRLLHLGYSFFLTTFARPDDKWKALLFGPCRLFGFFVSIRPWVPKFNPSLHTTEALPPVWIKLEGLPLEYFDRRLLVEIGNFLGEFLGMDSTTLNLAKASFAHLYFDGP